jgi:hypothetical protein
MFLTLILSIRIKEFPSESSSLPVLSDSEVAEFLASHSHSVILYEDFRARIEFTNYGIAHYRDRIGFAIANTSAAPKSCTAFPCFTAYSGSTVLPLPQPTHFSSVFATWLAGLLDPSAIKLSIAEQVRRVFMDPDPSILCVECNERPAQVPDSVPVYLVPQSALGWFMLKTEPGTPYLYRPKDRSFIPYGGNYVTGG